MSKLPGVPPHVRQPPDVWNARQPLLIDDPSKDESAFKIEALNENTAQNTIGVYVSVAGSGLRRGCSIADADIKSNDVKQLHHFLLMMGWLDPIDWSPIGMVVTVRRPINEDESVETYQANEDAVIGFLIMAYAPTTDVRKTSARASAESDEPAQTIPRKFKEQLIINMRKHWQLCSFANPLATEMEDTPAAKRAKTRGVDVSGVFSPDMEAGGMSIVTTRTAADFEAQVSTIFPSLLQHHFTSIQDDPSAIYDMKNLFDRIKGKYGETNKQLVKFINNFVHHGTVDIQSGPYEDPDGMISCLDVYVVGKHFFKIRNSYTTILPWAWTPPLTPLQARTYWAVLHKENPFAGYSVPDTLTDEEILYVCFGETYGSVPTENTGPYFNADRTITSRTRLPFWLAGGMSSTGFYTSYSLRNPRIRGESTQPEIFRDIYDAMVEMAKDPATPSGIELRFTAFMEAKPSVFKSATKGPPCTQDILLQLIKTVQEKSVAQGKIVHYTTWMITANAAILTGGLKRHMLLMGDAATGKSKAMKIAQMYTIHNHLTTPTKGTLTDWPRVMGAGKTLYQNEFFPALRCTEGEDFVNKGGSSEKERNAILNALDDDTTGTARLRLDEESKDYILNESPNETPKLMSNMAVNSIKNVDAAGGSRYEILQCCKYKDSDMLTKRIEKEGHARELNASAEVAHLKLVHAIATMLGCFVELGRLPAPAYTWINDVHPYIVIALKQIIFFTPCTPSNPKLLDQERITCRLISDVHNGFLSIVAVEKAICDVVCGDDKFFERPWQSRLARIITTASQYQVVDLQTYVTAITTTGAAYYCNDFIRMIAQLARLHVDTSTPVEAGYYKLSKTDVPDKPRPLASLIDGIYQHTYTVEQMEIALGTVTQCLRPKRPGIESGTPLIRFDKTTAYVDLRFVKFCISLCEEHLLDAILNHDVHIPNYTKKSHAIRMNIGAMIQYHEFWRDRDSTGHAVVNSSTLVEIPILKIFHCMQWMGVVRAQNLADIILANVPYNKTDGTIEVRLIDILRFRNRAMQTQKHSIAANLLNVLKTSVYHHIHFDAGLLKPDDAFFIPGASPKRYKARDAMFSDNKITRDLLRQADKLSIPMQSLRIDMCGASYRYTDTDIAGAVQRLKNLNNINISITNRVVEISVASLVDANDLLVGEIAPALRNFKRLTKGRETIYVGNRYDKNNKLRCFIYDPGEGTDDLGYSP